MLNWEARFIGLSVCKIEGSGGVHTETLQKTFALDWSPHNHHRSYLDQVSDVDPEEDVDE